MRPGARIVPRAPPAPDVLGRRLIAGGNPPRFQNGPRPRHQSSADSRVVGLPGGPIGGAKKRPAAPSAGGGGLAHARSTPYLRGPWQRGARERLVQAGRAAHSILAAESPGTAAPTLPACPPPPALLARARAARILASIPRGGSPSRSCGGARAGCLRPRDDSIGLGADLGSRAHANVFAGGGCFVRGGRPLSDRRRADKNFEGRRDAVLIENTALSGRERARGGV